MRLMSMPSSSKACRRQHQRAMASRAAVPKAALVRQQQRRGSVSSVSSRGRSGTAVRIVAFLTDKGQALLDRASEYTRLVGSAGSLGHEELDSRLAGLVVDTGLSYLADGVVYMKDRYKIIPSIRETLLRQHAVYRHDMYRSITSAVNEEESTVFQLVQYQLTNIGPFQGRPPTNATSMGWLIEKLGFDKQSQKLVSSLVTRQLTHEEIDQLITGGLDTATKWQPAAFYTHDVDKTPPIVAGANDLIYMEQQVKRWTNAWRHNADVNTLDDLLDPNMEYLDGYGGMPQEVGNGVVFRGLDAAKRVIAADHQRYDSSDVGLVTHALGSGKKLAFHHWRANATLRGSNTIAPLEGVALILFNEHLKIRKVLAFNMHEYRNLQAYFPYNEGNEDTMHNTQQHRHTSSTAAAGGTTAPTTAGGHHTTGHVGGITHGTPTPGTTTPGGTGGGHGDVPSATGTSTTTTSPTAGSPTAGHHAGGGDVNTITSPGLVMGMPTSATIDTPEGRKTTTITGEQAIQGMTGVPPASGSGTTGTTMQPGSGTSGHAPGASGGDVAHGGHGGST